jgi:formylglycine-generating enzyme required for sulfatase activity
VSPKPLVATAKPATPPPAVVPFDAAQAKAHQEAWAKYLGESGETTNPIGMKLIIIPPGEFRIGKGGPPVTLTRPYRLGVYEVTQGEWQAVMTTKPWDKKWPSGDNYPASGVTWNQAMEFCQKLTERERAAGRIANAP